MLTPKTVINLAKVTTCNKNHKAVLHFFVDPAAAWCVWHVAWGRLVRCSLCCLCFSLPLAVRLSLSVCMSVLCVLAKFIFHLMPLLLLPLLPLCNICRMQGGAQTTQKEAEDTAKNKSESKKLAG